MTIEEAKANIEGHLAQFLLDPEVSVDVFAYNSKVYYIILDGGGFGQQIIRLPITGNETVLDALALVNGLPAVSSTKHIWIARPQPGEPCGKEPCHTILKVDWKQVTKCGSSATNYQLFPGDRLYVCADGLITTDNWLAKIISPFERVFGVILLGTTMVDQLGPNSNNNGFFNNGF
jgi:polysaccharide export outer membrane protein